jgi:predicted acyl esterase
MKNKKIVCGGILAILLIVMVFSGCVTPEHYMIPMRDSVKLATDVYVKQPSSQHGSILIRTPYNKNALILLGTNWAQNNWPTVIQDMRGRFASEGVDTVFKSDHTDGPDTLDWIAQQPWSNGKVATFGGSALGITQYMTAGANPPQLSCQYIQVATPDLYQHAMYPGGEFRKNLVEGWLKGQGSTYILPELWEHENYTMEYWTNLSLEDKWDQVNVPAIHIGGWYDIFTQGTIEGFLGYQHLGGSGAQGKSKLILGPWTHGGAGTTTQGQLTYPDNSIDNFSQNLFWQMVNEYTMDGPAEYDTWPAVTYYVMGDVTDSSAPGNEWRNADDWPIPSVERAWYLQTDGSLQTNLPTDDLQFTYSYDPTDPVPTVGGGNLNIPAGPYDQRSVENRSDVLIFTSSILTAPYEATGAITARLFVSSDCPDTDFTVKLTDVYPDGQSMLITDGILRMRNRNGYDHWELMEPGTIYQIDVDLWSTSYVWNTGHQIRVAISSSNYPRCLNNPNTADGIYKNTTYNIAENSIYVDASHCSCLLLPEIPMNATGTQQSWTPGIQNPFSTLNHPITRFPERLQNLLSNRSQSSSLPGYSSFMIH